MPFIGGRYHINPAMGAALEAAREAEAALQALELRAQEQRAYADNSDSDRDGDVDQAAADSKPGTGPVHRVEIEAAEVVPSHSGRAARGFVARVHRCGANGGGTEAIRGASTSPPETHVFSDHRDLVSFLGDELGKGK
ncbi:MAG TPA: hypothetical protein VMD78_10540 [Candidatus Baltobacteraceae bacterium]|nr:hypothetical protein [Candidatus Baltobacteraceae bacterium]